MTTPAPTNPLNVFGQKRIFSRFDTTTTAAEVVADLDLSGQRALVTGGGSGIGAEIARALAGAGAEVMVADVAIDSAEKTAGAINATLPAPRVCAGQLDLGSLAATRAFARGLVAEGRPLGILVNNAGVMAPPLTRTTDGHELQFGVNFLGHFVLTREVLPLLRAEGGARVVSVSSIGHRRSGIQWDDPDYHVRPYDRWEAYGQSKTACALFAVALNARHSTDGVFANAMNPGGSMTGLQRFMTDAELRSQGWIDKEGKFPAHWRSPEQCAATSVWLATAPELRNVGGRYFEDCAEAAPHDPALPMKGLNPFAVDPADAARLWDLAEAMTN
ncbi:MAG: SDR family NAD(P)-dependent oxidoreductase [Pararhodobacter sp.]|nr:SDR family NAD(P)-dependent oxidoreductase [Pararhodobacter sp.]